VNGKRLYQLAREGKTVEREARKVEISQLVLEDFHEEGQKGRLSVTCSSGTYIRTLVADIGRGLGTGAVMTGLQRTMCAGFDIGLCHSLAEIQLAADEGRAEELILPIDRVFEARKRIDLSEVQTKMYKNGIRMKPQKLKGFEESQAGYRVYGFDGEFLGTALLADGLIRKEKNFY
jgi:tRNA pseudouridine55 synthase